MLGRGRSAPPESGHSRALRTSTWVIALPARRSMGSCTEERRRPACNGERSDPHPPMPRDKRGWQVSPAPDGRGMPEQAPSGPPPTAGRGFLVVRARSLLALNWLSVLLFQPTTSEQRVTVPFSPYFLEQVKGGEVRSIASKGDTIEGKLQAPSCATRRRQESHADEAVRHRGAEVLERQPALGAAAGKGRADQRQVDQHEPVAARASCCSASARRC